jgi:hypothetical protein
MHRTATGEKIKELRAEAARSEWEAATLAKVSGPKAAYTFFGIKPQPPLFLMCLLMMFFLLNLSLRGVPL